MHAIDERIRFGACLGDDPGAAWRADGGGGGAEMVAVKAGGGCGCSLGLSPDCSEWRRESARRALLSGSTLGEQQGVQAERRGR